MVGAHWNLMVGPARVPAPRFFFQHGADHADHVGTAGQMFGFVKRSVWLSHYLPQMQEVNASTEFASHG